MNRHVLETGIEACRVEEVKLTEVDTSLFISRNSIARGHAICVIGGDPGMYLGICVAPEVNMSKSGTAIKYFQ